MNVKKRVIYYLSGFDPRGVRHYHAMYKEHIQKQSRINGITATVSSRKKLHNHLHEWEITANDNGETVSTSYRFLSWDDIVRAQWSSGILSYYQDLIYCIIAYIFKGLVWQFAKASPKQMMAAFYPVVYLIGTLGLALYVGYILYGLLEGWIGVIGALVAALGIITLCERFGNSIGVFWLLRIYAFSVRWGKGEVDAIEERCNHFAQELAKTIREETAVDEVLLISHSVGTILAVNVLARALDDAKGWDKFAMITLGECIPLISFQPNAIQYRAELAHIASHKDLIWIDYTAPIDGACFPLHDFMKSGGIEDENRNFPLYLSPRFHKLYDKITYRKLRRDWYVTHFLYLMSSDKVGAFDYYKMSAGSTPIRHKIDRLKSH